MFKINQYTFGFSTSHRPKTLGYSKATKDSRKGLLLLRKGSDLSLLRLLVVMHDSIPRLHSFIPSLHVKVDRAIGITSVIRDDINM